MAAGHRGDRDEMGGWAQGSNIQVTLNKDMIWSHWHFQSSLWLLWGKSSVRGRNGGSREGRLGEAGEGFY